MNSSLEEPGNISGQGRKVRLGWRPVVALAVIPIVLGLLRLRLDTEVLDLLPPDTPTVEGLKNYQK